MSKYIDDILTATCIGTIAGCLITWSLPTFGIIFFAFLGAFIGTELGIFINNRL